MQPVKYKLRLNPYRKDKKNKKHLDFYDYVFNGKFYNFLMKNEFISHKIYNTDFIGSIIGS